MLEISARKVAQVAMMGRELNRAEGELRAFIDRMGEDEQAELVAIMWIGRESFFAEDLAEAIATAKSEASTPLRRLPDWNPTSCRITWRTGWMLWAFRLRMLRTT